MTLSKRLFDLIAALILLVILLPVIVWLTGLLLLREGRPVLYLSERMKTPSQSFQLWKFRTMSVVAQDEGVSGGHKASRITPTGAFLRKYRLDEIPQLWNVLRGDISFVGPRPPLRRYVEMFPETYGQVLQSRPGITGLATLVYHRHEEVLLAQCNSAEETEAVYTRRCVPQKARLDLIYQERRNLCLDIRLMLKTVFRRIGLH
jgi:lipopolysaccharide/colanic/teichoic acid biosynthesis glycosyltransferase